MKADRFDKSISNLLKMTMVVPMIITLIYLGSSIYRLKYPSNSGNQGRSSQQTQSSWSFASIFTIFKKLLSFVLIPVQWIIQKITKSNNPSSLVFRFAMLTILSLYVGGSIYYFRSPSDKAFIGWENTINTIIVIFGALFSLLVLSLFIKENISHQGFPTSGIVNRLKWSVKKTIPLYKSLIGILLVTGLTIGLIYLIYNYSLFSVTAGTLALILAIVGILFITYRIISNNPKLYNWITNNIALNAIYKFVFFIPTAFNWLRETISKQILLTPQIVWLIFAIEIVFIALWFLLPLITRYLLVYSVTKDDTLTADQELFAKDKNIIQSEQQLNKILYHMPVDWSTIISKNYYIKSNEMQLKEFLQSKGYTSINENKRKTLWDKLVKPSLSLEAAITYIQTNAPIIVQLRNKIGSLKHKVKKINDKHNDPNPTMKSQILLTKPVYLNTLHNLGSYENVGRDSGVYNYNYALSAWFFIHNRNPNAKLANINYTNILNYGDKPTIQYNVSENKLRIVMNNAINKKRVIYETTKFKMQRWNNIVINYQGGTLDIFINGQLVSTTTNIVPFMTYDQITAGAKNGISGGVCNVIYFSAPLDLFKIKTLYKSLKYKNPPVI